MHFICPKNYKIAVCDIDLFYIGEKVLCRKVGFEGIAYFPSIVDLLLLLFLNESNLVFPSVVPKRKFLQHKMRLSIQNGIAQVVVDIDVFVVEGV